MSAKRSLAAVAEHLDAYLRVSEVEDYPNALNGLQLANDGTVTRVGAAVDASERVLEDAVAQGVDLLLVHHGLFWGGLARWVGPAYRKLRVAIDGNVAVYSAHLPLDLHPDLGNNVLLARALGFAQTEEALRERGRALGRAAEVHIPRAELIKRLEKAVGGRVWVAPAGPEEVCKVAICTGGAGTMLERAAAEGCDAFITGEGPHHTFVLAQELRVNLLYAGHYATETFGVRALSTHLEKTFGLPAFFLDHPSGL